ncbi:MAG: hypothetical protein KF745_09670 [Phycisphaeraceae bacterium]|nr:hypothetical protein [Phycisphaeraceae bacterium]
MRDLGRRLRRTGIVLATAASVALGLALVWWFVTPQSLSRMATGELVAVLGLFVLPVITVVTWLLERRVPRRNEVAEVPPLALPNAVITEREQTLAAGREAGEAARRGRDDADVRPKAAPTRVAGRA